MISPAKGIKSVFLFLLPVFVFVGLPQIVYSQNESSSFSQNLFIVQWQGSIYSWNRAGAACWVTDSAGNLRFELLVDGQELNPNYLNHLLNWSAAEGYTAITTQNNEGTFSRWNEQWQPLSLALNSWLRVLQTVLDSRETSSKMELPEGCNELTISGRPLPPVKFLSFDNKIRVRRLQVPQFKLESSAGKIPDQNFRSKLSHRGRGRGGQQTIITVSGDASTAQGMRVNSTHQPGTMILSHFQALTAEFKPEEVFLPWWPLSGYVVLKK